METKVVSLEVKSNIEDVSKDVNKLSKSFEDVGKEIEELQNKTKETEKETKSLASGFKGVGLAMKAMGVGLIVSAMTTLKEVFMSNQKVADTFNAVLGTVKVVFSEVTNAIVGVIDKVSASTKGFEGLKNVVGGLITIALAPLKLTFFGLKLVIDEASLAWEESFFGNDDPETIKKLNKRIGETKETLVEIGKDALDAGNKVAANIGKAVSEIGQVVEGGIEGISKISIAGAYEQSKANIQLQNTAQLAEAQQARLVEQYDRQAEKLRQIRDNDLTSISERQKANDELLIVLNKQEKAMLAQADAQIASAQSTASLNNSIENRVALTNALANREGVLAQIEGLRSEQDSNRNALTKEQNELLQSQEEGLNSLAIEQKKFTESLETDAIKRLEIQRANLEAEKEIELERLQLKIDTANEGTQAKIDAELEYAIKKQEINNALIVNDNEMIAVELANSQARLEIDKLEYEHKRKMLEATTALLDTAAGALGDNTVAGKAAAVASATITTLLSSVYAFQGMVKAIPGPAGIAAGIAASGFAVLSGFKTVKSILAVKTPKASGGSSVSSPNISGAGGSAAPQFNVVGNAGTNQLAQTLANQNQQPIQTYVVASNVTTAQSLDRNIISNASIG